MSEYNEIKDAYETAVAEKKATLEWERDRALEWAGEVKGLAMSIVAMVEWPDGLWHLVPDSKTGNEIISDHQGALCVIRLYLDKATADSAHINIAVDVSNSEYRIKVIRINSEDFLPGQVGLIGDHVRFTVRALFVELAKSTTVS